MSKKYFMRKKYFVGVGMFGDCGSYELSWLRYWFYKLFTDYAVFTEGAGTWIRNI